MTLVHEITHLLAKAMLGTDQNTPEISKDRSWITFSRPADDLCVTNPTGNEVDVAAPCWRGIYSDQ
ncbi:hypothetical protein WG66_005184 [Moniliophthora roreri]|nr:hypothetical protein WG66_005184 [Moniliophthora roreri]